MAGPFDSIFGELCDNDETRKLAKQYFNVVRTFRQGEGTGGLPAGVVHICAWLAMDRYVLPLSSDFTCDV